MHVGNPLAAMTDVRWRASLASSARCMGSAAFFSAAALTLNLSQDTAVIPRPMRRNRGHELLRLHWFCQMKVDPASKRQLSVGRALEGRERNGGNACGLMGKD